MRNRFLEAVTRRVEMEREERMAETRGSALPTLRDAPEDETPEQVARRKRRNAQCAAAARQRQHFISALRQAAREGRHEDVEAMLAELPQGARAEQRLWLQARGLRPCA